MEHIDDCEKYNQIIKEFKVSHRKIVSNHYLLFDDVKLLIKEKRLLFEFLDNALLFFIDEGFYYNMSFMAEKGWSSNVDILLFDKECVTQIINRTNILTERNNELKKIIESLGFKKMCVNRYYEYDINNFSQIMYNETIKSIEKKGFAICDYDDKYFDSIHELWKSTLKLNDITLDDWQKMICKSIIVVDQLNNNLLCGVCMPKIEKEKMSFWHLAVNSNYRGKGLAYSLLLNIFQQASSNGYQKVYSWVEDQNTPSIQLHKKIGMVDTENISIRFEK